MLVFRVSVAQVRTLLAHARKAGVDTERVLSGFGLAEGELDAGADPARLCLVHDRLGRELRMALASARGVRAFDATDREIFVHYVIGANNLFQALERFVGFMGSHRERTGSDYRLESASAVVILRANHLVAGVDDTTRLSFLRSINQLLYLMSWLSGSHMRLLRIALPGEPCNDATAVLWAVEVPVTYTTAGCAEIWFAPQMLQRAVVRDLDDARVFLGCIGREMPSLATQLSLPDTVSEIIERHCQSTGRVPSLRQLAVVLNTSATTLRRRLQEQGGGAGFSGLRQGCQLRLAKRFLGDARLSVDDIALRIGFQDSNAFRRSFKRWTGMTPSAWRNEVSMLESAQY